jgi:hypothetical protein
VTRGVFCLGNDASAPTRQLLNVPVLVDCDVPQGELVVLDKPAVLSAYGPILVATSSDYLFGQDSVALRITFRFGAAVAKPERVVTVTLDHAVGVRPGREPDGLRMQLVPVRPRLPGPTLLEEEPQCRRTLLALTADSTSRASV